MAKNTCKHYVYVRIYSVYRKYWKVSFLSDFKLHFHKWCEIYGAIRKYY